ncbi:MAG TPA: 50S ribosomal protein L25 [Polyangiaceae bacterium]|jgi:large subunit ribosomal protein L25|nr:50S ribosomal protein L25 [Polyangiaceae bacterium]
MSAMPNVQATSRPASGKGAARRIRSSGNIPAVAYGKTLAATPIAVAPKDVLAILRGEAGKNTVIKMAIDSKDLLVMVKDYSYHPVTRSLLHVDFVEVKLDQPVDTDVPVVVKGKAAGVVAGGILRQVFRTLPVRCLPDRIPLHVEVDVTELKLNEAIATKDLTLGEGVSVRFPAEQTIISVVAPEKDRSEEAAAAPGAPAGKDAKGKDAKAAAAPAKDAKKK